MRSVAEVKQLRRKHDLTQSELAKLSGVSQSLIAKLESGRIDAGYGKVKKLFETLDGLERGREMTAGDVATARVVSIPKNVPVREAIKKMKAYSISQLPVMEREKISGIVTETDIMTQIAEGKDAGKLTVGEIMEEAPPTVSQKTPISAVTELLRHFPLVLVSEKGRLRGLITKADILNSFYRKRS
ncbi:CBS domain-containing protein [Candidatus Woesearchaeota archaeon]|nr:CBS domain-containing protein [Candidatus Woesearchaeota archaeon]